MRIDIVTVLPELLESPFAASILQRAQDKGLVKVNLHNLRDWTTDNYKSVDDYQYGGGAGMVMMPEPIERCFNDLMRNVDYDEVIYLTPDGKTKKKRPGVHAKSKTSKIKGSKNYRKAYRGQGK